MLYLHLDISHLIKLSDELKPAAEKALQEAAEDLSKMTYAHIVENVQQRLRSTRETYLDHLSLKQVSRDTWIVDLTPGATWIEDGMPAQSMVDHLLDDTPRPWAKPKPAGAPSGKTHTSKDGSRWRVIPFEHNKGPLSQTPAQTDLTNTIKAEMKRRKIPYAKIERNDDGTAKTGLLHSFDIKNAPMKSQPKSQGSGPIGQVRQGPTGIPHLQGIRVYQREVADKAGKKAVRRFITTFRIVSSRHKEAGRWNHPGIEARKFFEEALEWARREFDTNIAPKILEQIANRI